MPEACITIDDREKKALRFPEYLVAGHPRRTTYRLQSEQRRLDTGDYLLRSHPTRVIVERKASLRELAGNLLAPPGRRRFLDELRRLREECSHPILFIEGTPSDLESHCSSEVPKEEVRDSLWDAVLTYHIPTYFFPCPTAWARLKAAEWIASLLIVGAHHERPVILPGPG